MVESNQKLIENEKNLADSLSFKEPKKVPVGIEVVMWPFAYSGVTYKEVMNDPKRGADAYMKFFNDVSVDFMWGPPGVSKPIQAFQSLGNYSFVFGPDDTAIGHSQVDDQPMSEEEYDEFIKDPKGYYKDVILKRRLPNLQNEESVAYENLINALNAYKPTLAMNDLISNMYNEKGMAILSTTGPRYSVPLDTLFDRVRGMKNTLVDLRRRPEKVKAACDKIFESDMAAMKDKPENYIGKEGLFCGNTVYHSACFLNMNQFDEFFMSYLIKGFKPFFDVGVHMFIKGEGKFIHTLNRFRQLPKGSMVIMLEEDDPFDCYKEIGDWATLATGIKADLLKYGTKQQCIDYVKKCYDTFAPGGGFIFLQDRPLMCATDANIENLIAVYEFANEYGKKN